MSLLAKIKKRIPAKYTFLLFDLKNNFFPSNAYFKSFSNSGEDIILTEYLFKGKNDGFFVDVGAFHPKLISNTHLLYKRGWSGINIDPNPQSIRLFKRRRKRDINLQIGISSAHETKDYYNFSYSGVNTFDTERGERKADKEWNSLVSKEKIECFPLGEILDNHLHGKHINLLDIDVEGMDLEVLKSNDWSKYKPDVILVEDRKFRDELGKNEAYQYLHGKGYQLHSYNNITLIMVAKEFKQ